MSREEVEDLLRMTHIMRRYLKAKVLRRASYSYLFWVIAFPVGVGLSILVYLLNLSSVLYAVIWLSISLIFAVIMKIWESSMKIYAYIERPETLAVKRGRRIHKLMGVAFLLMIAVVISLSMAQGAILISVFMASIYECVAIMNILFYLLARMGHGIELKEPLLVGILVSLGGVFAVLFPEEGLLTAIIFIYVPYLAAWISLQVKASRVEAGDGLGEDS